jgi:hypothetical protein
MPHDATPVSAFGRAALVFNLAGELGEQFDKEPKNLRGQSSDAAWAPHAAAIKAIGKARAELLDQTKRPRKDFADVAEQLDRTGRVVDELVTARASGSGSSPWVGHQAFVDDLHSVANAGWAAIAAAITPRAALSECSRAVGAVCSAWRCQPRDEPEKLVEEFKRLRCARVLSRILFPRLDAAPSGQTRNQYAAELLNLVNEGWALCQGVFYVAAAPVPEDPYWRTEQARMLARLPEIEQELGAAERSLS